ncbi:HEAT repeat containing 2 [Strigomonas culicis]|uniref:HEAT repeat containing 2 n=1 Tax=Strigomonas culicis TaxID=28005 RepID=S9U4H7_9TRYP|nr:HEAT repeat containing 2 [Strigomonas culicis]EPY23674.1 HEAT repeat containing 2 [Strigomonas culicis]EPY26154.1 HEAT repeat containing 2 [Strigomonas culicis]|eukprot:EPY23277.1 HEAT repeat containing 2 [Strigomonas culicis]
MCSFLHFSPLFVLVQMESLPKYIAALSDANKMKRCAAYKKMSCVVADESAALTKEDNFSIIHVCLKGFEDSSERCREEAVKIISNLVSSQDANILDWVLPSIVTRIGVTPITEESEEIRLQLLLLSSKCMSLFPHDIGPRNYMDFFQVLLENCFSDPFPDLKKEACRIAVQLCAIEPKLVKPITVPLAKAIKNTCLLHKHSSVRGEAATALSALVRHGASEILADTKDEPQVRSTSSQLYILCNDHSESVRLAVLKVLSCALLDVKDRLENHSRYLPHVLLLTTDDFEAVQQTAQTLLNEVGKAFVLDNEDNRIDVTTRRVTLKDIEWYADDEYPDMALLSCPKGTFKILDSRPLLGSRHAVAEAARGFLTQILTDATAIDWVIPFSTNNRRVMALRILWAVILHIEKSTVQHTERILGALYKALRDDNADVRREATLCVELIGKFLTPDQYLPFIISKSSTKDKEEDTTVVQKTDKKTIVSTSMENQPIEKAPTLFSTAAVSTKCSVLATLGYFVNSSQEKFTVAHAKEIVQAMTSNELTESENEDILTSLLDCFQIILPVMAKKSFVPNVDHPLPDNVQRDPQQRTLDSIVFYALLRVKASSFPSVQLKAAQAIEQLSSLVTGSQKGIYELHATRILHRYAFTMPVGAFADLVLNASQVSSIGAQLTPVFLHRLSDIDFSVRTVDELRYFSVLEQLLWGNDALFSPKELEELLTVVIVPLGTFQPGQVAHLFRKIAVNCICALSAPSYVAHLRAAMERDSGELANKVVLLWCSASDSDDGEMRLICVSTFADLCCYPMAKGPANELVQSLILRFDDPNDLIRLRTAEALLKATRGWEGLSPPVKEDLGAQMVPLVKKILIYMDDDDDAMNVRAVLREVLEQLGAKSPNIVVDLTRSAMAKHKDPAVCQAVIDRIERESTI